MAGCTTPLKNSARINRESSSLQFLIPSTPESYPRSAPANSYHFPSSSRVAATQTPAPLKRSFSSDENSIPQFVLHSSSAKKARTDATRVPENNGGKPSFAAQTVKQKLVADIKHAVRPRNGLHVSFAPSESRQSSDWDDIGSMTVTKIEETLRKEQPLAMALLEAIATGPQRKRRGKDTQRRIRPV